MVKEDLYLGYGCCLIHLSVNYKILNKLTQFILMLYYGYSRLGSQSINQSISRSIIQLVNQSMILWSLKSSSYHNTSISTTTGRQLGPPRVAFIRQTKLRYNLRQKQKIISHFLCCSLSKLVLDVYLKQTQVHLWVINNWKCNVYNNRKTPLKRINNTFIMLDWKAVTIKWDIFIA